MMRILIVTDIDNPGLKEDTIIAKAFIRDGHQVVIARQDYDKDIESYFDIILLRNIWHLDKNNYENHKKNIIEVKERLKKSKIPIINLYSKFDDNGKLYLVDLYQKGYPVIPTSQKIETFDNYNEDNIFLQKHINGYDGCGIIEKTKQEITNNIDYIIQPKIKFIKEVEFYFINKEFQYVLEFVPSKKPIYPIPKLYDYTIQELEIAQQFADLCDEKFRGVQRIDFLKTEDNKLLLLEIGDSAPYLNLNSLDEDTKEMFIQNYKKMVYNNLENI